jgi:hypothetical protein
MWIRFYNFSIILEMLYYGNYYFFGKFMMKVWTIWRKIKGVGKRRRTQRIYTGSPSNPRVHPVPSLLEGFHYDLYKVKQENNPLFFTLLLPTILDSKVFTIIMNFIYEFEYKFEYNRMLIYKVLDFVFSFNITIQNCKTLSAQETLTLIWKKSNKVSKSLW